LSFRIGRFKSADARGRYLTQYEELRALSPQPDVVHDVPTEFGTVRVYQHGPDDGVPVVLIHGFFLTLNHPGFHAPSGFCEPARWLASN